MGQSPSSASSGNRTERLIVLALVAATVIVYWPVQRCGFVYDDVIYVTQNLPVQAGLSVRGLWWALTAMEASNWHPLTWLSLQLDAQLYQLEPAGYHLTNLALHIANTLLLFFLLRRWTAAVWPSAFTAALFAVHPLHVESVAWITERKDVLSTFFWFLTLWAYTRYVEEPRLPRYLLVAGCLALGLMAKPMLVTLPFVMPLLDYWPLHRWDREPPNIGRGWLVVEKLPLLALSAASCVLTWLAQAKGGSVASLDVLPLQERLGNALVTYVEYIGMMFWPHPLAVFYPHPLQGIAGWQILGAGVILAGITALAFALRRRTPYLLVGWLWYVGTLVPVIGLVQVGAQALADRYTYVPLIGLFVMLSWGIADLVPRIALPRLVPAVAGAGVLAACMVLSAIQIDYWHDSVSLWQQAVNVTDGNYVAHYNLGLALARQERTPEAQAHYEEALRIKPSYAEAHNNLGVLLEAAGNVAADRHFELAVQADRSNPTAHFNWAKALERQNKPEEASAEYRRGLEINPESAPAHNNFGLLLARQHDLAGAIAQYHEALRIQPDYAEAHLNLGAALAQSGDPAEAVKHFTRVTRLRPNLAVAYDNLGLALVQLGKGTEAVTAFQEAVRREPRTVKWQCDLAHALWAQGHEAEARSWYQQSLALDPNWPAQANRAAWDLATNPAADPRDGPVAVQIAQQICEATDYHVSTYLDTLAAAYAAAGQFDRAAQTARQALALLAQSPAEQRQAIEERLHLYEKHEPFRGAGK